MGKIHIQLLKEVIKLPKKNDTNLSGFRRANENYVQERTDIIFSKDDGLSGLETDMSLIENLFSKIGTALNPDLSDFIPSYRNSVGWAHKTLPDHADFEPYTELAFYALEYMKSLQFGDEIPPELITWAENFDWDTKNFLTVFSTMPDHPKTGNFLALLIGFMANHVGTIEGSIENIINEEDPETSEHWHAARVCVGMTKAIKGERSLCIKIADFIDKAEWNYDDLPEKLFEFFTTDADEHDDALELVLQGAFEAGWIYRDLWWRQNHGEAARKYYEKAEAFKALGDGRLTGTSNTKDKALKMREKLAEIVELAVRERGMAFAFASPDIQASTVREIAETDYHDDFCFQNDRLVSLSWFKERIEDMKATGELVAISERVMKKA